MSRWIKSEYNDRWNEKLRRAVEARAEYERTLTVEAFLESTRCQDEADRMGDVAFTL